MQQGVTDGLCVGHQDPQIYSQDICAALDLKFSAIYIRLVLEGQGFAQNPRPPSETYAADQLVLANLQLTLNPNYSMFRA